MTSNIKKLTFSGILLAVGFILHQIAPAGVGGVTFDFMLAMVFIIMMINKDFKTAMIAGIAAGVLTALTTKFPGGQIPNMIDKPVTVLVVYGFLKCGRNIPQILRIGLIGFIGTLISGSVFLSTASILVGLPASFIILFYSVVIPTAIGNTIVSVFLYKIVLSSIQKVNPSFMEQLEG
ncbi:tryptophan transporter [Irregularibacter muris]|uniref:Tryptophan transporter n=1 Tax=Irregularibacter muris TaxID=1796619 RepID=A0AAE3HDR2_9FIRM|nr:tryptophan transporter [Irregularibacter muris]MCR1898626.1 tryptophan transporter [Irregularibacter muris]